MAEAEGGGWGDLRSTGKYCWALCYLFGDLEMLVWPGSLPGILLVVPGGAAGFEEHEVTLSRLRTKADLVAVAWGAARRHIKAGGSRGPCRGLCRQVGSLQAIRGGSGPRTAVAARW